MAPSRRDHYTFAPDHRTPYLPTTSRTMSSTRIAIIGAGPAGLTLACLLQKGGLACTVYELDHDQHARDQGGIIDLHPQGGQLALREAGLFKKFESLVIPAAEAQKLVKSDGSVHWDEKDMKAALEKGGVTLRERPEVDRTNLRAMLIDSVKGGTIKWGAKLVGVQPDQEGKYNLQFNDTVEKGFDLVVGADGAWSKVRPLLTDVRPHYSGVTTVELRAYDVEEKHKWLAEYVGSGSLFMFDEGRQVTCQRQGNNSIRVYAAVRQPESWINDSKIDWENPEAARGAFAERFFGDCHTDIQRVITDANDAMKTWPLYMLPIGHTWEPRQGVTLVGDAAHLMTPFAGVGVNVAMADALGLARAILKQKQALNQDIPQGLKNAVKEYEAEMFVRGKENMEKTWKGLENHFSKDGIDERVEKLRAMAKKMEETQDRQKREMKRMADGIGNLLG